MLETCSSPTFLDKYDSGVGQRLFVTCFADGEIYVLRSDAAAAGEDVPGRARALGSGVRQTPTAATSPTSSGFGDNNISVIDLAPGSPDRVSRRPTHRIPESHPPMTRPHRLLIGLLSFAVGRRVHARAQHPADERPQPSDRHRVHVSGRVRHARHGRRRRPDGDGAVHGVRPADAAPATVRPSATTRRRQISPRRRFTTARSRSCPTAPAAICR